MFKRKITETVIKAATTFPVTVLTGPRQSGKTTLLRYLFPNYKYISLESPDTLLEIQQDPRGFLDLYSQLIIDEAQHYPELFSYLQEYVDKPNQPGKYILSGSQNFLLAEKISQSLAGRAAILELLPLTIEEFKTSPEQKTLELWDYLFHGSYPRPYHEHLDTQLWYDSYIQTYLERDVRSLVNVRELSRFQLFLKLCAGRHGQLLNLTTLGHDCGISQTTAAHWLSILEASYIVYRLTPYYRNFNKRLVKTPKLYFYDTAIVCRLLGIESPQHLSTHAHRGAIFEGFILTEIIKTYKNKGKTASLYFWRDQQGNEIDAILEQRDVLIAIEIKSGKTLVTDMFAPLRNWQKISGSDICYLIYGGTEHKPYQNIKILPWDQLPEI